MCATMRSSEWVPDRPGLRGGVELCVSAAGNGRRRGGWAGLALAGLALMAAAGGLAQGPVARQGTGQGASREVKAGQQGVNLPARTIPPRVIQAHRFLAERGWTPSRGKAWSGTGHPGWRRNAVAPQGATASTATLTWQALGPAAVLT